MKRRRLGLLTLQPAHTASRRPEHADLRLVDDEVQCDGSCERYGAERVWSRPGRVTCDPQQLHSEGQSRFTRLFNRHDGVPIPREWFAAQHETRGVALEALNRELSHVARMDVELLPALTAQRLPGQVQAVAMAGGHGRWGRDTLHFMVVLQRAVFDRLLECPEGFCFDARLIAKEYATMLPKMQADWAREAAERDARAAALGRDVDPVFAAASCDRWPHELSTLVAAFAIPIAPPLAEDTDRLRVKYNTR